MELLVKKLTDVINCIRPTTPSTHLLIKSNENVTKKQISYQFLVHRHLDYIPTI